MLLSIMLTAVVVSLAACILSYFADELYDLPDTASYLVTCWLMPISFIAAVVFGAASLIVWAWS
jgi:hypothetical protein